MGAIQLHEETEGCGVCHSWPERNVCSSPPRPPPLMLPPLPPPSPPLPPPSTPHPGPPPSPSPPLPLAPLPSSPPPPSPPPPPDCSSGFRFDVHDADGDGKMFSAQVATVAACAAVCRSRECCAAFEFSPQQQLCATYTSGFDAVVEGKQHDGWRTCVASSSAGLRSAGCSLVGFVASQDEMVEDAVEDAVGEVQGQHPSNRDYYQGRAASREQTNACTPCDDEPGVLNEYLRSNNLTCSTYSFGLNFRCNISSAWREIKICRHSCYFAGHGCARLAIFSFSVAVTPTARHMSSLTQPLCSHPFPVSAPLNPPPLSLPVGR